MPATSPDRASAPRLLRAVRRRQAALQTAWLTIQRLQQALELRERERALALADTAELRLRHARPTARLYTLEAERQAVVAAPTTAPDPALQQQVDRLRGAERQNQALEQEMGRLRTAIEEWTRLAPPAPTATAAPPTAPWYRRFWLMLIGKEVRGAEWSAAKRTP